MTIPVETVTNGVLIAGMAIAFMMVMGTIGSFIEETRIFGTICVIVGMIALVVLYSEGTDRVGTIKPNPSQNMFEISQSAKHPDQSIEDAIEENYGLHYDGGWLALTSDKMSDFTKDGKPMECKVHAQYNEAETQLSITVKCVEGDKMVVQKPLKNAEYSTQNTKES